jgi:nucleoside-diphosphate-sugar epimerase
MPNPLKEDLDLILAQTESLWDEISGNRIFITGGTGFFGCWLLESFAWANEKLKLNASAVVLSRHAEPLKVKAPHLASDPAITFHQGDITSFDFLEGQFSHVIHAAGAASASLNEENPLLMFETVVQGTKRALDFAVACGAKKVLFASSGAVYGKQPPDVTHVSEDYLGAPDTLNPLSAYAEGKRAAEFLCSVYGQRRGLEMKIARCFSFVGPYLPLDIHYAIGNFLRDGMAGGPIQIKGDGTPYRSYLYTADLVTWLWTVLFRGEPCRPYNVGSDKQLSIRDLGLTVAHFFGPEVEVDIARRPDPAKQPERYVPSVSRASSELGLSQTVDMLTAIARTVAWHEQKRASDLRRACGIS